MTLADLLGWAASATSIASIYAYGRKSLWGPRIGLLGEVFWYAMAYEAHLFGLFVCTTAFGLMHINNYRTMRRSST